MTTSPNSGGGLDREQLKALVQTYKQLHASTAYADQRKSDEVLDELQDAVGLAGRMVTDKDILRAAGKLLGGE